MGLEAETDTDSAPRTAVSELLQFVRTHSPFYRDLYKDLPAQLTRLEDVPVTDNDEYWKASNGATNRVLTTPLVDGIVLRSGGTSNVPKTAVMTRGEFQTIVQMNGVLMAETNGLLPGDRVANLAVHGGLYSGFVSYHATLMACPLPLVNLPVSGNETLESITRALVDYQATVVICTVYNATRLAEHLQRQQLVLPGIRRILYSGEAFYADLRELTGAVFPNAQIRPLAYGSVELKFFAFHESRAEDEADADVNPLYKVNRSSVLMELIDGDGAVIRENGRRGRVVGTSLLMRLQPKIRYPLGDLAEWVDYEAGLFRFRGRESVGLKITNAQIGLHSIRGIMSRVLGQGGSVYQLVVSRSDRRNVVTIRVAAQEPENAEQVQAEIEEGFMEASPAWRKRRDEGRIAPIRVEWVAVEDLVRLESGKLKPIVEERFEGAR